MAIARHVVRQVALGGTFTDWTLVHYGDSWQKLLGEIVADALEDLLVDWMGRNVAVGKSLPATAFTASKMFLNFIGSTCGADSDCAKGLLDLEGQLVSAVTTRAPIGGGLGERYEWAALIAGNVLAQLRSAVTSSYVAVAPVQNPIQLREAASVEVDLRVEASGISASALHTLAISINRDPAHVATLAVAASPEWGIQAQSTSPDGKTLQLTLQRVASSTSAIIGTATIRSVPFASALIGSDLSVVLDRVSGSGTAPSPQRLRSDARICMVLKEVVGDLTGDGTVDLGDAGVLDQLVVGLRAPTARTNLLGDIDGDGKLTQHDLTLLGQFSSGSGVSGSIGRVVSACP